MQAKPLPRGSSYVKPPSNDDQGAEPNATVNEVSFADATDDSQSVIGVSLGPAQTALASPSATKEQKAHALQDEDIRGEERDEGKDDLENESKVSTTSPSPVVTASTSPAALPSPWTTGSKNRWLTDGANDDHSVYTSYGSSRNGSSRVAEDSGWRKFIPTMPSIPSLKALSVASKSRTGLPSTDGSTAIPDDDNAPNLSRSVAPPRSHNSLAIEETKAQHIVPPTAASRKYQGIATQGQPSKTPSRPSMLRRSTSDGSLHLQRSLSRASSLGDDNRWVDVREQVNSRGKAIRDSIADSNLKLPKLPDLPSFNISEALSELQATRKRSASLLGSKDKRQGSPDKRSNNTSINTSSSPRRSNTMPSEKSPPPGMTKTNAELHPHFTKALHSIKGDVVVLGGYRGSVLRSANYPYRQCWVPVKVGLGIRKVNLEVGLRPEDEERMEETIIPDGMLKNIGPVDISRRLFKRLSSSKQAQHGHLRVWDFGYDWRLSPHLLGQRLIEFLETLPCNSGSASPTERGATVIAHSLGGLLTRFAVNKRPELFNGVVYAGVPQTCVNILGPLRNGDEVLLSSKVLTAQVNFTIRTSFALLPLDGKCFFNRHTNEPFDVDFFDAKTWDDYHLSPCISRPIQVNTPETSFGSIGTMMDSITSAMPNWNIGTRYRSDSKTKRRPRQHSAPITVPSGKQAMNLQMNRREDPGEAGEDPETIAPTAVTISKSDAETYLARTLADVKSFKEQLAFDESLGARGAYPPTTVIYGKSVPTVYGACVKDRESIKRSDAYDNLAFASGDGVVLARAAQLPEGYTACKGGVVSSDRGHISLLGDLEAVGRCLNTLTSERRRREKHKAQLAAD